jgi:outer membrane scaffolding protein for murein synthesis (MipA/OmpV family)
MGEIRQASFTGLSFGVSRAGYDRQMLATHWRLGFGVLGICLALQVRAEGQVAIGGDRGYLLGASVVSANGHIGSGVTRYDIKPLWAFQLGPFRVSRSRANSLMRAGRERLETGVSAEFDVFSDWRLGASLRLDNGRSFDGDPEFDGLPDVRSTLRGRVSTGRSFGERWNWSLSLDQDLLGRGGGARLNTGVNYRYPVSPRTNLDFSLGGGWGDARYQRTIYGISTEAAQATGREPYRLGSGWETLRVGAHFETGLSTHWVVFGGLDLSRVLGSTARSPLVGRLVTHGLGVGVAYRSK